MSEHAETRRGAASPANGAGPETPRLTWIREPDGFPDWAPLPEVARFLRGALKPYDDPLPDVVRGIEDALSPDPPGGGFVVLASLHDKLVGALVMLRTGMQGYIPENLLLYVAVDPDHRGHGIGALLCRESIEAADGDVKLHVEYDNPAKRLYERLGFESKYAEMRHTE